MATDLQPLSGQVPSGIHEDLVTRLGRFQNRPGLTLIWLSSWMHWECGLLQVSRVARNWPANDQSRTQASATAFACCVCTDTRTWGVNSVDKQPYALLNANCMLDSCIRVPAPCQGLPAVLISSRGRCRNSVAPRSIRQYSSTTPRQSFTTSCTSSGMFALGVDLAAPVSLKQVGLISAGLYFVWRLRCFIK